MLLLICILLVNNISVSDVVTCNLVTGQLKVLDILK